MRILVGISLAVVALGVAGCDQITKEAPTAPACEGGAAPTVTIDDTLSGEPVAGDLTLTGTVTSSGNRAIRRVDVAGVRAKSAGFNFETWSVVIPIATLRAMTDGQQMAQVVAVAHDACDEEGRSDPLPIPVADQAGVVRQLMLEVLPPGGASFFPANGAVPAVVRVLAASSSAGGTVHLETTRGTFDSGESATDLVLQQTGSSGNNASASALLTSSEAGDATITATGGGQTAQKTVTAAGPPVFSVPSVTLQPGQEITIRVSSDGQVEQCQANASDALTATIDGADLSMGPHTVHAPTAEIHLVAGTTTAEQRVSIQCSDVFGQSATAVAIDQPGS